MILSPRWTSPALCKPGGRLSVILAGKIDGLAARMRSKSATRSLGKPVSCVRLPKRGCFQLEFAIPGDIAPGLYNLALMRRARVAQSEPASVWISGAHRGAIRFVHVSDFHIVRPGAKHPVLRDAALRRLVRHLREEVRPEFILETGDVVTRYGRGKRPLPAALVRRQIRMARMALLRLGIPYFLTPGNHDMAFPNGRRFWTRLMGAHWNGARHDYGFTLRGVRFLALDRAVAYDRRNRALDFRVEAVQKKWLRSELAAAKAARLPVVLFCHYDYTKELAAIVAAPPVVKALYGHKNHTWLPPRLKALDGLLNSSLAYQVVKVFPNGRAECRPGEQKAHFLETKLPRRKRNEN